MKAILKNGIICPNEPVPDDWMEGTELEVEKAKAQITEGAAERFDQWLAELDFACSQTDADDDQLLKEAILEIRRQEKEFARKQIEVKE